MALVETIRVWLVDGGNDGDVVIINKSDFNGTIHKHVRVPLNRPVLVTEDDVAALQYAADKAVEAANVADEFSEQAKKNGTVEDIADAEKLAIAARNVADNAVEASDKACDSLASQNKEDDSKD